MILAAPYCIFILVLLAAIEHAEAFLVRPKVNDFRKTVTVTRQFIGRSSDDPLQVAQPEKKKRSSKGGGGRAPSKEDELTSKLDDDCVGDDVEVKWQVTPCQPSEARLIVIQITDVYTLEHLASVKTLVEEVRANATGAHVISMLTGDFLSPYLLASVDRGQGMMDALNAIPIDYITWGNHEADLPHKTTCKHVRAFVGTWLNSNMLDHEAMDFQKEFDVVELCSLDGSNERKVGLVALLSNDPKLYEHFEAKGGAFGGATIDDPWETLAMLQSKLMAPDSEYCCDTIIPLQHLYVPDDKITCRDFEFPVVLSGHDHHRVDEMVNGTRLLKPGLDAIYATVMEMSWPDKGTEGSKPKVKARFVKTDDWTPDPSLYEQCERAYDVLEPLRNTEILSVPLAFQPLSSVNSRGKVTTMGKLICTLLKKSMNVSRRQRELRVDAVMVMGGNIRGGIDYEDASYFSLEALEAEIKPDEVVAVVPMPGWLLAEGVSATHAGDPIPGWMQYDDGIKEEYPSGLPPVITHVAGRPIDHDKIYRVATKISDLTNGQSMPFTKYYKENSHVLPPKGAYVNVQAELMSYFAKSLWRGIWDRLSEKLEEECDVTNVGLDSNIEACHPNLRLEALDTDHDGVISVNDIQHALKDILGLSVDEREQSLAEVIHDFADTKSTGKVTLIDIQNFCEEIGVERQSFSLIS